METTTAGPSQKRRSVEEAVSYAVGHRVRVEILGILNEGTRTADQLARTLHQPLSTVSTTSKNCFDRTQSR